MNTLEFRMKASSRLQLIALGSCNFPLESAPTSWLGKRLRLSAIEILFIGNFQPKSLQSEVQDLERRTKEDPQEKQRMER